MRSSSNIVAGCFFGAEIEPGTFHGADPLNGETPTLHPANIRCGGVASANANRTRGQDAMTLNAYEPMPAQRG